MKTWENWSIDCGDKDESKVVISGSATSLDRVYINFESGADAGNYIITYNDGIRCITKTYTVAGAPCEIEWLGGTECITCDCICDNLVLNEASVDISKDGCSDMAIGSASDCITNIVTTTETWVRVNAVGEGLYLNVDANANSSRSTTVTFDYGVSCDSGKSCTKTLTVNQAGGSCDCGSITYEGSEEADPTPTASGFKVNVTVPSGKASAYVSLYDANNTFLCGISRYQGGTIGAAYNWTAQGTVAKVAVTENGSSCKYLTINGKTGTTYLSKTQINTGSTVTNLDLTRTFDTSDYNDDNALLYFTFQDS